jgi:hypothetical protein
MTTAVLRRTTLTVGRVATRVVAAIIAVALIAGSALAITNKASKTGYQALCAPIFTLRHHYSAGCLITTADLRYGAGDRHLP